jgi:hypothetical protein
LKIGYYNISDMNATDALQFIEDYSSTTIDGYKSRQSLFNNIDIRRKIFGIKTAKIKDAMERNEQVVKFNKLYWGDCMESVREDIFNIQKFRQGTAYRPHRAELITIRPMWSTIENEDRRIYNIYEKDEKWVWKKYLELGHDDFISQYE